MAFRVDALLSYRNTSRDEDDKAMWREVRDRVEDILKDPRYEAIYLSWGGFEDEDSC